MCNSQRWDKMFEVLNKDNMVRHYNITVYYWNYSILLTKAVFETNI